MSSGTVTLTPHLASGRGQSFHFEPSADMARQLHEIDRFDPMDGMRGHRLHAPSSRKRLALDASVLDGASSFADLLLDPRALEEQIRRPTRSPSDAVTAGVRLVRLIQTVRNQPAAARVSISSRHLIKWNLELGGLGLQTAGEPRPKHLDPTGAEDLLPPRALHLPERLATLLDEPECFGAVWVHPLLQIGVTYFMLQHDRPFARRNRATARAWLLASLLHRGYVGFETSPVGPLIAQHIDAHPAIFFEAVESGDLSAHLSAFLSALWHSLRQATETTKDQLRSFDALQAVAQRQRFNLRELALLDHALRHPESEYSIRAHQRIHGVAYATARKDLKRLSKLELFEESQPGERELLYRPAPYLKTRLSAA